MGNHIIRFLFWTLTTIRATFEWLVIILFGGMSVIVLVQVLGRYIFNYPIDWATEAATFTQIWMVLIASGLAMNQGKHVNVDILLNATPKLIHKLLLIIIACCGSWFLYQCIIGSLSLIQIGTFQTSPAMQIAMWIPYLALPIGLIYLWLEFLISMIRKLVEDISYP